MHNVSSVKNFNSTPSAARAANMFLTSINGQKIQNSDDDEPLIFNPIKSSDPRVKEYRKKLADAKKKQKPISLDDEINTSKKDATEFGKMLASTLGNQIVLLGQTSRTAEQWSVFAQILKIYKDFKSKSDARQILLVMPADNSPDLASSMEEWNATSLQKRKKGKLGEKISEGLHYKSSSAYRTAILKKMTEELNDKDDPDSVLMSSLPVLDALNYFSSLGLDIKIFPVSTNFGAQEVSAVPGSNGASKASFKFDKNYLDNDSVMALNIAQLRQDNPDSIIIGMFPGSSVVERNRDNAKQPENISEYGMNLNDPMAEQLSLLCGEESVHTIRIAPNGGTLNQDSYDNYVTSDEGQFDRIIRINRYDPKKPWKPSW